MRNCLFCDEAANSREDAWPRWLLKRSRKGTSGPIRARIGDQPERVYHSERPLAAKVVCQGCNNGWMSDLESRARDVIEPMLEAVRAYCTLFEIRHALEQVYGSYREPIFF